MNHELPSDHEQERQRAEAKIRGYVLNELLHLNPGVYENGDDEIERKNA